MSNPHGPYGLPGFPGNLFDVREEMRLITKLTEDTAPDWAADDLLSHDASHNSSNGGMKRFRLSSLVATQATMEAAASVAAMVTPGRQHFHPAHPKVVAKFGVTGNLLLDVNVSSITDNGTGDASVNLDTNFNSTTTMCALVSTQRGTPSSVNVCERITLYEVGKVTVNAEDSDNENPIDPTTWTVAVWGDYA
jgi:hypothetical protein